jgi:nicotinate-nucleotide adenylyltransferase
MGGTFDPIHNGHLNAAREAARILGLQRVLLIPSARPPHKGTADESSAEHRLAMTRSAAEHDPLFEVLDLEIARGGNSYTLHTLQELRRRFPDDGTWYRLAEVLPLCDWAVLRRPGHHLPSLIEPLGEHGAGFVGDDRRGVVRASPLTRIFYVLIAETDVSSTRIREKVGAGLSIEGDVPPSVADYIRRHGLYAVSGTAKSTL